MVLSNSAALVVSLALCARSLVIGKDLICLDMDMGCREGKKVNVSQGC